MNPFHEPPIISGPAPTSRRISPCPDCGNPVSKSSNRCPRCGCKIRRGPGFFGWVFLLMIVFPAVSLFVGSLVIGSISAQNRPPSERKTLEDDPMFLRTFLIQNAKREVLANLKAPSSAKFPDGWLSDAEYQVVANGDRMRVSCWVDSPNGFGAMIRSQWFVDFAKVDGEWTATGAQIGR
jgi:hypothetical protein